MFCNKIADLILACRELIMSKNIVADGVKVGMLAPITIGAGYWMLDTGCWILDNG